MELRRIDRFDAYMAKRHLNDNKVTVLLGLTNGVIGKSRKEGRDLSDRVIEQILNYFPDINRSWLLYGSGDMLISEERVQSSENLPDRRVKLLPLLPFSAVAGYMAGGNDIDAFRSDEAVSVPDFSERGADCTIRVDGDSMYPRYSNGEILAIRIIKDPTFFQWGKVYVLSTNQGCVVKILLPDPKDPERIVCRSVDSERYPDYSISMSDVFGVAIVVGHAGVE